MVAPLLLILVLAAAAVSALNPYTIGVLVMLISVVLGRGHPTRRMVWLGLTFTVSLLLTSLLLGAVFLALFSFIGPIPSMLLSIGVGLFIAVAGILEIKDYFWYGHSISLRIPRRAAERIKQMSKKAFGFVGAGLLGIFVAVAALPNTSAAYLAIITILKDHFTTSAIWLLALYNIVFVLPMIILLVMAASGVKISTLQRWKEESKGRMRLGVGLLLVALGWAIILIANGVVNFG
jgi:cytochrome c biogenesis protein CcdA